jgi:lysophospholipase L1-like esterase
MLTFLQEEYAKTPLYVVLTTSVDDPVREARVRVRNRVAAELAAERGLPVIDLYAASVEIGAMHTDGVHFSKEGYACLADCILNALP